MLWLLSGNRSTVVCRLVEDDWQQQEGKFSGGGSEGKVNPNPMGEDNPANQ